MEQNLVIVESPAKAKTIGKYLGKDFVVKSSFGHIRDLAKNKLGIDIENNFTPQYLISPDKEKLVKDLCKISKEAQTIYLASDEDREGEAIAWHLQETLGLKPENTKRIAFHEITKDAILNAIENPRTVNMDLVMAQQARRVIDRLVGYEVSPILWKKIKPKLSAGRVQSVALRLIVEKEEEIINFKSQSHFKVEGIFNREGMKQNFKAELNSRFDNEAEALAFLQLCPNADFSVASVEKKAVLRSPAPPFTTSTLQQEAARKLGFSVNQTMSIAQRLYEAGFITYMRTDSTNLSSLALNTCKQFITAAYGSEYAKTRQYSVKSKGAQEAHEAIRPTFVDNEQIQGNAADKRLYNLIRKRTLASQMADAKIEKTQITITAPGLAHSFTASGEVILFEGFIKAYQESSDEEMENESGNSKFPKLQASDRLAYSLITATERFTQQPWRFSEASLVKKLEELGIGRPSTYAPTISTIIAREYVSKSDRSGAKRNYEQIRLEGSQISQNTLTETYGAEKAKLFPTDMGILVNKYLVEHFPDIMDYGLTARVEENLDKIAGGHLLWTNFLNDFYPPLKKSIDLALSASQAGHGERELGKDPKTGKVVIVRIGRFGPIAQIGTQDDPDKRMAGLQKDQLAASISLEEALKLFELPRSIGQYKGEDLICNTGRFGPYIKWGKKFISIPKTHDPHSLSTQDAEVIIEEYLVKEQNKHVLSFPEQEIEVLKGRFGPYIACKGVNYKIPKTYQPDQLSVEDCLKIIAEAPAPKAKK